MARTVVPPQPGPRLRGGGGGDGLPEKLAKYVPAETLAFFVPVSAAIGTGREALLVAALVVGAIGTPAYLWLYARKLPSNEQPLLQFYVLSVIAFGCWALGTSAAVAALVGTDVTTAGVILFFAVFLIPLTDGVLAAVLPRARAPGAGGQGGGPAGSPTP